MRPEGALSIAGSDPSGGAGLQADMKTFTRHGVFGTSVLTLLTVQNSLGVLEREVLTPRFVRAQLEALLSDMPPQVIKTGALGSSCIVEVVSKSLEGRGCRLIVDPVMISKNGTRLLDEEAEEQVKERLLPMAFLVTPNLAEASRLSGIKAVDRESMIQAAKKISKYGATNVLVKGGHLSGTPTDILFSDGEVFQFEGERIDTPHTHGVGCVYSAAITALLAKGASLREAISEGKKFVTQAIKKAPNLGAGSGPTGI